MDDRTSITKFNGEDFACWKIQMESLLEAKELAIAIQNEKIEFTADRQPAFEKIEKRARSLLLLGLDTKHLKSVLNCKTAKQIWIRLKDLHENKSISNKMVLQKEFFDLKMKTNENVQDFISRAEFIHGNLKDIGVVLEESTLVAKIVSGLTSEYTNFVSNWSYLEDNKQQIAYLLPRLMNEHLIQQTAREN